MEKITLKAILEASPSQLSVWRVEPLTSFDTVTSGIYCKILYGYLVRNPEVSREQVALSSAPDLEKQWLLATYDLREVLRSKPLDPPDLEKIRHLSPSDLIQKSELRLLLAMVFHQADQNETALGMFREASSGFHRSEMPRRHLTCIQNEIVCKSHIDPDQILYADYTLLAKQALDLDMPHVAGVAYLNISREFQLKNVPQKAFAYSQKALKMLEVEKGTVHYELAVLHQAHLLIEAGEKSQALEKLEQLALSPFSEVKEARKFLDCLVQGEDLAEIDRHLLTPTWQERVEEYFDSAEEVATELEVKILESLIEGPRDKFQLVERIYSEDWSDSLEGRLKNLISRIRKKYPELIVFDQGKYSIKNRPRAMKILIRS